MNSQTRPPSMDADTWSVDPAQLQATYESLKKQATDSGENIETYATDLETMWTQWSGEMSAAAQANSRKLLQQARMSQNHLWQMALCLQRLSGIYQSGHDAVQRLWSDG